MRVSYLIAILIAGGVAAWVVSGQFAGSPAVPAAVAENAAPASGGVEPALMTVRVEVRSAVLRAREVVVRGYTEASRQVVVRAEVSGTIDAILVRRGDRVTAGQVIARIDLGDRTARLSEAEALLAQREMEHGIARSLVDQGHQPVTRVVAAQTALQSAAAALERIQLEIEKTEIKAPFSGIIEDRAIEMGDFVNPGGAVAHVVDEDPFLVVGQVTENDVGSVHVGDPGSAVLLDGTEVLGVVRFVATVADAQTRTFRVEIEVPNANRTLRAGLTATLTLPVGAALAHFVSPAALVLDEDGALGVKSVTADGVVEFYPARVLASEDDGVWLDGLPETLSIITVGHQFVRAGDHVRAVADNREAGL